MEENFDLKEKAFDALSEMHREHEEGGRGYYYRYNIKKIPGFVVVATVDEDEAVELNIYRNEELNSWYKAAIEFIENLPGDEREDFSIGAAMDEVESKMVFEFA